MARQTCTDIYLANSQEPGQEEKMVPPTGSEEEEARLAAMFNEQNHQWEAAQDALSQSVFPLCFHGGSLCLFRASHVAFRDDARPSGGITIDLFRAAVKSPC